MGVTHSSHMTLLATSFEFWLLSDWRLVFPTDYWPPLKQEFLQTTVGKQHKYLLVLSGTTCLPAVKVYRVIIR